MSTALLIMGIVVGALIAVLASVQTAFERQSDRSQTADQARLAIEELDRQIRSGNLLYDPVNENDATHGIYPNMSLRVYTQNNATTRQPGNRCEQWRIQNQELDVRDWSPAWRTDGVVDGWRVVADHVVNQTLSPQIKAFVLDPDPAKGGRAVQITIVTNERTSSGKNVTVQAEVTGRDTEYGYPSSVCSDIPPY